MTWQWIPLGILIFLVVLFALPISIRIGYSSEVSLAAGAFGIYFPILPKKKKKVNLNRFSLKKYRKLLENERAAREKKKQKSLEKARKKKSESQAKKIEKGKKLPPAEPKDEPSVISLIMPVIGGVLDTFAGKLRIKVLHLQITVGGSDAAQIGMMYGIISQGVAYLLELLSHKTKFRRSHKAVVNVVPDFLLSKTKADIRIIFRLRIWDLVTTGIHFLIRFLKEKASRTPDNIKMKPKEV